MGNAVDYAWARPSLDVLWDAGVRTVGRYIGPPGWGKTMEQAEYDALVAKFGRDNIFGVFEIGNDDSSGGFDAGVANAKTALQYLPAGYPEDMAIFLAADEELEGAALDAAVEYFHGASTVIAPDASSVISSPPASGGTEASSSVSPAEASAEPLRSRKPQMLAQATPPMARDARRPARPMARRLSCTRPVPRRRIRIPRPTCSTRAPSADSSSSSSLRTGHPACRSSARSGRSS